MLLTSCTTQTQNCILTRQTYDIKFLIRMIHTTHLMLTHSCLRWLTFRVKSSVDGCQFFNRLFMWFKLFRRSTCLSMSHLNVFSFLLLPHQRHQHVIRKLIYHLQLILTQFNHPITSHASRLRYPVHIQLVLQVWKSQTPDTEGMTTRQENKDVVLFTERTLTFSWSWLCFHVVEEFISFTWF